MRKIMVAALVLYVSGAIAQTVTAPQPVEEQYRTNYWWWILGVLIAIGAGVVIYFLIKKDPKRDAV